MARTRLGGGVSRTEKNQIYPTLHLVGLTREKGNLLGGVMAYSNNGGSVPRPAVVSSLEVGSKPCFSAVYADVRANLM